MMKRDEMLKAFARQRKDEIVVAVYMAAQEITHISPHDLNYTFTGAMGQGSSHALGLALGRPDRRIIVFDGDGSLLMNLGSLVTIANQAPKNLVHCLCDLPKPQDTETPTNCPMLPNGSASCRAS
jgi:phosphonopyruvate decarboxylase